MKTQPTAAILVIGDEILSGRTLDSNSNYLANELTNNGINLSEVRVIGDEAKMKIAAINFFIEILEYFYNSLTQIHIRSIQ